MLRLITTFAGPKPRRASRCVGLFQTVQTATESRRLMLGRAEQRLAPVRIAGTRDGSNELTIIRVRRTRIGGERVDPTGSVPLGEAREQYEVDVCNPADTATLRTFTGLVSPVVACTAAQQTADGFTPGDPVRVHVHRISGMVGRGRRRAAIVRPARIAPSPTSPPRRHGRRSPSARRSICSTSP